MEDHLSDELALLGNALRTASFRFILVAHNRRSVYVDVKAWLTERFGAERTVYDFSFQGKETTAIRDAVVSLNKGILIISDLDFLFRPENAAACTYFNQRRDFFARFDIAFVCFIQPSSFPSVAKMLPDWWSLRSLELEFIREREELGTLLLGVKTDLTPSNLSLEEKGDEILRLKRQIEQVKPENQLLLNQLYAQVAELLYLSAQFDEALTYLEKSLEITQKVGDNIGEGRILNNISQIYHSKGEYDKALLYLEQALIIKKRVNDLSGEGSALNNISQIYDAKGDYDIALKYLEEALSIEQQIGNRKGEGTTLNNLAANAYAKGNLDTALVYWEQALAIQKQIGDRKGEGSTLSNLATRAYKKGDNYAALYYWEQALVILQQIGDINGVATTLHNIGAMGFGLENYVQAIPYLMQAFQIWHKIGSPNAQITEGYLNDIIGRIGETAFQKIVSEMSDKPLN